jgi:hypothetical protein
LNICIYHQEEEEEEEEDEEEEESAHQQVYTNQIFSLAQYRTSNSLIERLSSPPSQSSTSTSPTIVLTANSIKR